MRQYFATGLYPGGGGALEGGVPHEASGVLVKAVLIGGAHAMLGYSGRGPVPMAVPSGEQGWGRVSLSTSLPLTGNPSTVANLQVVDLAAFAQAGKSHQYCLQASGGPLTVTLVWHDAPASQAVNSVLVNDLDLSLRSSVLGGQVVYSNGAVQPDRVNNVERIRYDDMPAGDLAITVAAHFIHGPSGGQSYSLVVQGSFSGQLQSTQNPALGGAGAPCLPPPLHTCSRLTDSPCLKLTSVRSRSVTNQACTPGGSVCGSVCQLAYALMACYVAEHLKKKKTMGDHAMSMLKTLHTNCSALAGAPDRQPVALSTCGVLANSAWCLRRPGIMSSAAAEHAFVRTLQVRQAAPQALHAYAVAQGTPLQTAARRLTDSPTTLLQLFKWRSAS